MNKFLNDILVVHDTFWGGIDQVIERHYDALDTFYSQLVASVEEATTQWYDMLKGKE